jgi:menaquinone reductase, molybdopterin-binding-like subunit
VRMAAGWPVGIAGVASHPITRGALCPLGYGAHQLNWHPQRLRTVRHRTNSSSWEEARAAFAKACGEGPIAIIDGYPGRAASSVFESFAQKRGSYRAVLGPEMQALSPYEMWSGVPAAGLGYDLENAQTVVSFGAPLLDGWGTPGRFTRLWAERAAGSTDPQLRLIQVEPSFSGTAPSRTATRAWQWVPIHAGAEAALAAGLARVLLDEHLVSVSARGPMPPITLAEAADETGLSIGAIADLARTMVARPPVLVIANDGNPAIAALNVVLGAAGAPGGIVRRAKHTESYASAAADICSARAVLIDSTVPWNFAPPTNAEVFRFAAWDGGSCTADWLLPAPGFLEELTDVPTSPASAIATYAVAPTLLKAPPGVQSAAQFLFLSGIDPTLMPVEKIIHARCADLFRERAGTLQGQDTTPVAKFASVQKLEEQLWKGAVWIGEPPRSAAFRCALKEWPATARSAQSMSSSSMNWSKAWRAPVLPPLASKLYQESSLREAPEGRNA